ncbi:MAG: hypothetical protein QXR48_00135 [Candidatus Woesearchaeota archaeon]
MADEGKGVAYAILGIVAVIAVVGLVLLFKGGAGKVVMEQPKVYGGGEITYGLDQYSDGGFVRYSDNRVYAGAEYVFPERIKDTGGAPVPIPTYNSDYKRTGPVKDNPCPYAPYTVKVTAINAAGRNCIRSGIMPEEAISDGRIPSGYEDFYCCTP